MLVARDLMTENLVTVPPDMPLHEAVPILLKENISGVPVVDEDSHLLGILSELDCLREAASAEFLDDESYGRMKVADAMSTEILTVEPETGIYRLAHLFTTNPMRRLPVLEDDRLVGLVCRRDVVRGFDRLMREGPERKRYPDYPEDRVPTEDHHRSHRPWMPPTHSRYGDRRDAPPD